jgi:exonuclease VII small subunit
LKDLLRIRHMREDAAASQCTSERKRVAAAEESLQSRQKAAADFHAWRLRREDELYAEVVRQPVHRGDLDELRSHIDHLRAEELALEAQVHEAEKHLKECQDALAKAHLAWQQAIRDREKISEHREQWVQEEARERETLAEKELEDFRVRASEQDDPPNPEESADDDNTHPVE